MKNFSYHLYISNWDKPTYFSYIHMYVCIHKRSKKPLDKNWISKRQHRNKTIFPQNLTSQDPIQSKFGSRCDPIKFQCKSSFGCTNKLYWSYRFKILLHWHTYLMYLPTYEHSDFIFIRFNIAYIKFYRCMRTYCFSFCMT